MKDLLMLRDIWLNFRMSQYNSTNSPEGEVLSKVSRSLIRERSRIQVGSELIVEDRTALLRMGGQFMVNIVHVNSTPLMKLLMEMTQLRLDRIYTSMVEVTSSAERSSMLLPREISETRRYHLYSRDQRRAQLASLNPHSFLMRKMELLNSLRTKIPLINTGCSLRLDIICQKIPQILTLQRSMIWRPLLS